MIHLLRNRESRLTFATTLLFFVAFYTLIVPLPRYLAALGLPDWQIGLVLGGFGIAALLGRPWAGLASDRLSRRGVILTGTLLFVIGVLAVERTASPWLLLMARVLQALGYVAVTTAATARITDVTAPEVRGAAIAAFGIAANLAMTLTPAVVDVLLRSNVIALQGAFWLAALIALSSLLLAWQFNESKGQRRAAQSEQGDTEIVSWWVLPPAIVQPWIATALLGVGFGAWLQYLPLLTERRGVEPSGILYAVYGIAIIITRILTGPLLDGGRKRLLLMGGFGLLGAGLLIFAFTQSMATYIPATALVAAGGGILHPLLIMLHVERMPATMRGRAVATFYLSFDLGNGLGTWVLGFVLQWWGLTQLFALAALVAGVGVALTGWRERQDARSLKQQLHSARREEIYTEGTEQQR
ncbi:MAG: MFS transporter [Chloroflexota bacterium]|nr:MFS transporter [Chloroflexota bacterium]